MGSGNNSASLAADYLRRGGSYIEALKLILADLDQAKYTEKGDLLCDAIDELRIICGQTTTSTWTNYTAQLWGFWLDRTKAAGDDAAPAGETSDKSNTEKQVPPGTDKRR